jgi:uncharacterized Zn-finger protein
MQMQSQPQTYLPPIRTLLQSTTIDEVGSSYNRSYSPSHSSHSASPPMTSSYASISPQSTDAHHLAAINAHNKIPALPAQYNMRSLMSPPESPELKTSGYQSPFDSYGYEIDGRYMAPQYEEQCGCSCCIKPTPVYSASAPAYSPYSHHQHSQPQRYTYPISTAPSLPRLNTVLENLNHYNHKSLGGQLSPTGSSSGNRYQCPYCSKRFSRPSSLRIHTYSHTGEKPFVCTEPGCGRKFSVQSNMRRHLRVHRLGRPVKKNRYDGEVESYKVLNPASILRSY